MPYRCVHCSKIYADGSSEILQGCTNCKSKFFFYLKEEKIAEILKDEGMSTALTGAEKDQIEQDVREITGITDPEKPVFLDFESISIIKPGKYLIDIEKLLAKEKPRVYKLEDGKYIVDLGMKFRM